MNLGINDHLFLVCGATSGLGLAIASALVAEGAQVLAMARSEAALLRLQQLHPGQIETICADATAPATTAKVVEAIGSRRLHGALVNAGGPPAKTTLETTLQDWDDAYSSLLRWKVSLTQAIVPLMVPHGYGRLLFIESASVKQPLENLVLSSALRMAVVGMVKTLSQEIASTGITLNVLAPGSHQTPAIERIYLKKSQQTGLPIDVVRQQAQAQIPVRALGEAADFASLAVWLLCPLSRYVTGQVYAVDGGSIKSSL
ncbi:MAG: SDR family oxidoreductase [Bacteroidetes bacterium]|nr:MAG: SDR family oxidoreductase [Bacteroidota bacterium]